MQPARTRSLLDAPGASCPDEARPVWTATTRRAIAGTIRAEASPLPPCYDMARLPAAPRSPAVWPEHEYAIMP